MGSSRRDMLNHCWLWSIDLLLWIGIVRWLEGRLPTVDKVCELSIKSGLNLPVHAENRGTVCFVYTSHLLHHAIEDCVELIIRRLLFGDGHRGWVWFDYFDVLNADGRQSIGRDRRYFYWRRLRSCWLLLESFRRVLEWFGFLFHYNFHFILLLLKHL